MSQNVTIIDYGLGNLYSVTKAFEHVGATVQVTSNVDQILAAEHLVLPGVGAFNQGMAELNAMGIVAPLRHYAAAKKPLMGICLGMQMLFEIGEENGTHAGLGIIPGKVMKAPAKKIPHIGWATLHATQPCSGNGKEFYFVHSYHAMPANHENILATVDYEGHCLTAAVISHRVVGYQFHPEKSRQQGLDLCKEFLSL